MNGLMSEEIPAWVEKFERLLRKLYWFEATAHIWTDFIDGCYQFWWHASESVIDTYWNENPQPSGQWDCQCLHFQRERHSPPINLWGEDRSG